MVQNQTAGLRLAHPAPEAWAEEHESEDAQRALRQRLLRLERAQLERARACVQEGVADHESAGVAQDQQLLYVEKEQEAKSHARNHELVGHEGLHRNERAEMAVDATGMLLGWNV